MSAAEFIDRNANIIDMGTDQYVLIQLPSGDELTVWRNGVVSSDAGKVVQF
jgi:hypothetical protein